jgi:hypothetical protein
LTYRRTLIDLNILSVQLKVAHINGHVFCEGKGWQLLRRSSVLPGWNLGEKLESREQKEECRKPSHESHLASGKELPRCFGGMWGPDARVFENAPILRVDPFFLQILFLVSVSRVLAHCCGNSLPQLPFLPASFKKIP